jgi:MoxR-like ATPase
MSPSSSNCPVLLIDEIDKAGIEFPNDLLQELDRMEFFVYETGETIKARQRPIVIITSNNEKELPHAFLRRCFFHSIKFPERETMQAIIDVHFPGLKGKLVHEALNIFYDIREVPGLKKKPSTSEQAPFERGRQCRDLARARSAQADPAAPWGAAQERAGRVAVREACFHGEARREMRDGLQTTRRSNASHLSSRLLFSDARNGQLTHGL